jgi:hypothetical protein
MLKDSKFEGVHCAHIDQVYTFLCFFMFVYTQNITK